jgi:hypothetical protein
MEELNIVFKYERSTKGAHRYQEEQEATEAIVGTLYVRKWAIGENAPDTLTLKIEEGDATS